MVLFRLSERSIGMISTLILARLLLPADFGLVAMAMSLVAALEILSAFSFDVSLIQNQQADRSHYDTAWTLNVLTGMANAILLLSLASPIAVFFQEPRVELIAQCLALNAAVQGFTNIGVVAFQKDLQFHREFQLGMARRLASFCISVTLAFALRTYWALVIAAILSGVIGVVLSYWMHPYRPRFSLAARTELLSFSKWLLINNILIFLMHRTTDFVIGRYVGAQALGTYNISYEVSNLPTTELVFPIARAVFPGYSRMAHDLAEIRKGYLDVLSVTLLFVVPAGLGILAVSDTLVLALLGEKWSDAIPLIQVLALFGVLRASVSNAGAIFMALGIPRLMTRLSLLYLALMGTAFAVLVPTYSALGAAYGILIAASIQIPVVFAFLCKTIALDATRLLSVMWRPLMAAAIMAIVTSMAEDWLRGMAWGNPTRLIALIPLGATIYFVMLHCLWIVARRPPGGEALLAPVISSLFARIRNRAGFSPR